MLTCVLEQVVIVCIIQDELVGLLDRQHKPVNVVGGDFKWVCELELEIQRFAGEVLTVP